jgi:hypothetical protein
MREILFRCARNAKSAALGFAAVFACYLIFSLIQGGIARISSVDFLKDAAATMGFLAVFIVVLSVMRALLTSDAPK